MKLIVRWILGCIIMALALNVIGILYTGGFKVPFLMLIMGGKSLAANLILLILASAASFVLAHPRRSSDVPLVHVKTFLFLGILGYYLLNGQTLGSGDTWPARFLPLHILRNHDFYLDAYLDLFQRDGAFNAFRKVGDHCVSAYPVGSALMALPLYIPSAIGRVGMGDALLESIEKIAAAIIVALSAIILYAALSRLCSRKMSLFATLAYALGTSSLSISSQALWQHGPSQLALAATLYCLVRGRIEPHWICFAGFPLSLSIICRPNDVMIAIPIGIYVLFHYFRRIYGFLLAGVPAAAFQLWYNTTYFGHLFHTQFSFGHSDYWSTPLLDGLSGLLFSPGRGLFIYSPVVIIGIVGFVLAWRRGGDVLLRYLSIGSIFFLLLHAKWWNWWGGYCFGPRLLADLGPLLMLGFYPLDSLLNRRLSFQKAGILLFSWSVIVHSIGIFWNNGRWDGYIYPEGLWNWTDNQLVNPPRILYDRIRIIFNGQPTSQTSPELLSVSYVLPLQELTGKYTNRVKAWLEASNDGSSIWLVGPRDQRGTIMLSWTIRKNDTGNVITSGMQHLRHDVFPRDSYLFGFNVHIPKLEGEYDLDAGLVYIDDFHYIPFHNPPAHMKIISLPRKHGAKAEPADLER